MNKIKINNEVYIKESDVNKLLGKSKIVPSKKQIVILQRGWVVVGNYSEKNEECTLTDASVIRTWGTTKGLGEIAEGGPTTKTILDKTPDIRFHKLTVIARIDVNESNWK